MQPQIDGVLAVLRRRAQQLKMECDDATPAFICSGLMKPDTN
jgi:hypothetical protein